MPESLMHQAVSQPWHQKSYQDFMVVSGYRLPEANTKKNSEWLVTVCMARPGLNYETPSPEAHSHPFNSQDYFLNAILRPFQ